MSRPTTPLHYAKERWCDYLKPHSKLNTHKYYTDDPHYQFLAEHFVTAKDWEYEQTMERIREENKREIEELKKARAHG